MKPGNACSLIWSYEWNKYLLGQAYHEIDRLIHVKRKLVKYDQITHAYIKNLEMRSLVMQHGYLMSSLNHFHLCSYSNIRFAWISLDIRLDENDSRGIVLDSKV